MNHRRAVQNTLDVLRAKRAYAERVGLGGAAFEQTNDLGIWKRLGSIVTAGYDFPRHMAQRIRREIDPWFRPLESHVLWESPNGGLMWVKHLVLARYMPTPPEGFEQIDNLLLPTHSVHGMRYERPLVIVNTLDGLSDAERDRGIPGRFEPFGDLLFSRLQERAWHIRNKNMEKYRKQERAERREMIRAAARGRNREFARRHEELDRERFSRLETGGDNRTFVDSTKVMTEVGATA